MSARAKLITDSDSDSDSGSDSGEGFSVNAEYARRFEHNKKREELHRLEEKYGAAAAAAGNDDEQAQDADTDTDTDTEDEDDGAVLATLELDREIDATLTAIRKKDPRVYDGKTTFYTPLSADADDVPDDQPAVKTEKPITLKDYHLRNLLSGTAADDAPKKPKTFVQEQADLKHSVVQSMHAAAATTADDDDDDDDAFLTRKPQPAAAAAAPPPLPDLALADKNPDEFLNQFLSSRAWAAATPAPLDDDGSDSADDAEAAEAFERAYNFRFENPDVAARGALVSYSRDAVSSNTVRREDKSARKVARERKRERREAEAAQRAREMGRLRRLKMEELLGKVRVLQEAAGAGGEGDGGEEAAEAAEALERVLEGEWAEEKLDEYIASRFGDEYYRAGKADKPVFEDDIDIDDIVPGFEKEEGVALSDDDDEDEEDEDADDKGGVALNAADDAQEGQEKPPSKKRKSKKAAKADERKHKQKTKQLKRKLEKYVDDNYGFEAQLPAAGGGGARGFRYRETTPETYGLTSLDILAASDQDLNTYVGLKRLAAFREPDRKRRDRKRYGKKKRLREWRREVFGDEKGVQLPEGWRPEGGKAEGGRVKKEAGAEVADVVGGTEGGRRKRRKHKP